MMNNFKNVINLSKIFIKENDKGIFNFIDVENRTINKKSKTFWALIVLFFAISYLSSEAVDYLNDIGKPEIFINGYFLFLQVLLIMQSIILGINIFYFSKDNENILFLPFKPYEIFVAKFNTLLYMLYSTELIFGLFPLFIYGNNMGLGISYVFKLFFILIILPVFFALIISIAIMVLMNLIKLFKNKNLLQFIISTFLMIILFAFVSMVIKYIFYSENNSSDIIQKLIFINKYFVVNNFAINILIQNDFLSILLNFFNLIFINFCAFLLFVFIGNKLYLNQLLKTMNYYKNKLNKKFDLNKRIRKNNVMKSYIKKDVKLLFRNPLFFMQSVYPVMAITVSICILLLLLIPRFSEIFQLEEYKNITQNLHFDIEVVCIILGLTQVVGLFNYCSVTAFSREGHDAYVNKFLPISFYKQFIYKNVPQVVVNVLCIIPILAILKWRISAIDIKYIFVIFVLAVLMILINSFILCLIDLLNPNFNWKAEYEILKNNKNKLLQYVLIVFNVMVCISIYKIFKNYNLNFSLFIIFILFFIVFVLLNVFIYKYKNKLFNRIY